MIIMQILGGLGNQMFQYACGKRLAHDHHVPLKLDISSFASYPLRSFTLQHYQLHADIATPDDLSLFHSKGIDARIRRRFENQFRPYWRRSIIHEQGYGFNPPILNVHHGYLIGYWQSYKYFEPIASHIRDDFKLKNPLSAQAGRLAAEIQAVQAVSLHIRRGDYVSNPETQQVHGVMTLDYYERAVRRIAAVISEPHFFIFSDDPDWAIVHLHLAYPSTIVSGSNTHDYEELCLLSLCKHHIIANSSFSWWGAWLSDSSQKIVIAPNRWTLLPEGNTPDRIPSSWIRME